MPKSDVLARVAADLARGQTQPAIQRLSSLVAVHPTDLELRRRLAAVHRQVGNQIEAGRWAYLDATADPAEITAFERAFPSPTRRLDALRWRSPARFAATEYARQKLEALSASAAAMAGSHIPANAERLRRAGPLGVFALLVVGVLVAALAVVGVVTVVQWML
jgi:hypothetical protein